VKVGNGPRCQATCKDGSPCGGPARASGYCWNHDPELEERRRSGNAKGGRNRSNAARAWREFEKVDRDASIKDLTPILFRALRLVATGELPPNVTNSMATLGRAIVDVAGAAEFDERLRDLEQTIAESKGAQLRRVK
jgi:hypothetical protein